MKIRNVWRRFLVWLGVLKLKPEAEIKRLLDQAIRVEEQTECDHKILSALFPNDVWYRCTNCNQVWIITEAMQIKADKMPLLIKRLQQVTKMKPKNKRIIEKAVDKSE
jgi:hypothetical protein